MKVNNQYITFNMLNAINCLDDVEDCNFVSDIDFVVAERLTSCCRKKKSRLQHLKNLEMNVETLKQLT